MTTEDKATALVQLAAAEAQLGELRLRILADASDLAEVSAARDAAGWLARHTRSSYADARADLRLATALDRDRPTLAAAMREGAASLAQARVIERALGNLPVAVDAETVALAEKHLVDHAREFGPKELGRIGRRILDVIAPHIAEAAEAARLADLEAHAAEKTRLTMRRLGDGTTRISARLADAAATRLATYLEAFTNPRHTPTPTTQPATPQAPDEPSSPQPPDTEPADTEPTGTRSQEGGATAHDPVARQAYPRRMGHAFVQLLETLDPTRLPVHGGDATTVVVTIDLDALKADLATADLIGAGLVPGDELTGDAIAAAQARRLACTANILPAVLGGHSLPLDLGRTRRLFTPAQRKALLIRDKTCRAEGCDTPGTWCEAHHHDPWHTGGPTDLANAVLLCSHHHHRAHDPTWRTERLPNGDHRFHPRR
nr:HNH endonuclease signature motif containing protein [Nocardioides sp. zg-1230]